MSPRVAALLLVAIAGGCADFPDSRFHHDSGKTPDAARDAIVSDGHQPAKDGPRVGDGPRPRPDGPVPDGPVHDGPVADMPGPTPDGPPPPDLPTRVDTARDTFQAPDTFAVDVCLDQDSDGVTTCAGDCDDLDFAAKPGQTSYFAVPSKGVATFDYNCNKTIEREVTNTSNCRLVGGSCVGSGWSSAIPDCGKSASYDTCQRSGPNCKRSVGTRTQRCR